MYAQFKKLNGSPEYTDVEITCKKYDVVTLHASQAFTDKPHSRYSDADYN